MSKVFSIDAECNSCGGTGIYQGFGERDRIGVVCKTCAGTGCEKITVKYTEFRQKKTAKNIKWVLQTNPGISVRTKNHSYEEWGGMSYKDWADGKKFPPKSEMRKFSCPAWWYQCCNWKLKPKWNECIGCGAFSDCKHFGTKEKCWERWDKEHQNKRRKR